MHLVQVIKLHLLITVRLLILGEFQQTSSSLESLEDEMDNVVGADLLCSEARLVV